MTARRPTQAQLEQRWRWFALPLDEYAEYQRRGMIHWLNGRKDVLDVVNCDFSYHDHEGVLYDPLAREN